MYGYIYKTTNLINGYIYIGQHKYSGESIDKKYFGSGKILKRALKKHGKENFTCEIIEWCETHEEINIKEKYYIYLFCHDNPKTYNIAEGGSCGDLRKYMSEDEIMEWRQNLSTSHIGIQAGDNHPMYGKHHTEESKHKNSIAHQGENHPNYGEHLSEETRKKISDKAKLHVGEKNNRFGKHHSEKTKLKMSISSSKKVINLDTGEIFNSLKDASERYNIGKSCICNCCRGKTKTSAGYHWTYYDES